MKYKKIMSKKKNILKYSFLFFLNIIFLLNFSFISHKVFIYTLFIIGLFTLFQLKIDKDILKLWLVLNIFNISSYIYSYIFFDIEPYYSWLIQFFLIPFIFQYILNSVKFLGLKIVYDYLSIILYIYFFVTLFILYLIFSNGFNVNLNSFKSIVSSLNNSMSIIYQYGFSRGYIAYFFIGLIIVLFPVLKSKKIILSYALFLTFILGAKSPFLGLLWIILLLSVKSLKLNYLIKKIIIYTILIFIIVFIILNFEIINFIFVQDGRYIFPVFIYSDFWSHYFGSGFGNYSIYAFKEVLHLNLDYYSYLFDHPRVIKEVLYGLADLQGVHYSGRKDILFPIAESDLLFFSIQLGSIFTLILFFYIIKIFTKHLDLFMKDKNNIYEIQFFLLFNFLLITSILQDYFNSIFSWFFFGMLFVFYKFAKYRREGIL